MIKNTIKALFFGFYLAVTQAATAVELTVTTESTTRSNLCGFISESTTKWNPAGEVIFHTESHNTAVFPVAFIAPALSVICTLACLVYGLKLTCLTSNYVLQTALSQPVKSAAGLAAVGAAFSLLQNEKQAIAVIATAVAAHDYWYRHSTGQVS